MLLVSFFKLFINPQGQIPYIHPVACIGNVHKSIGRLYNGRVAVFARGLVFQRQHIVPLLAIERSLQKKLAAAFVPFAAANALIVNQQVQAAF